MAKEKVTMKKLDFGPRRGVYIDIGPDIDKFAVPGRNDQDVRGLRPRLPHALRHSLQLRADVGAPGREHLVGTPRRGHSLPHARLRHRRSRMPGSGSSSPTPRGTRRWGSTRCGRSATRSRGSARRACSRRTRSSSSASRISSDSGAIRRRRRRSSRSITRSRSTGIRPRRRRSSSSRPAPRASAWARASGSPSARWTRTAPRAPLVQITEGEGGMTPGRVAEAFATASAAQLWNIKFHIDWNQASIDSNKVCRDGDKPGDYVQWDPIEFCYPPRLERDLRREGPRFQARSRRPRGGEGAHQRPADRDRVPHDEGLAVRHRGAQVARRGAQVLLPRVLQDARAVREALRREVPEVRGQAGAGRRRAELLGHPHGRPQGARGEPRARASSSRGRLEEAKKRLKAREPREAPGLPEPRRRVRREDQDRRRSRPSARTRSARR